MLSLLLPANQNPPVPVKPRVRTLYYPPPRRVFLAARHFITLPALLQVQNIITGQHGRDDILKIIALVQAQVVQAINDLFWAGHDQAIQSRLGHTLIMGVRPGHHNRERRGSAHRSGCCAWRRIWLDPQDLDQYLRRPKVLW